MGTRHHGIDLKVEKEQIFQELHEVPTTKMSMIIPAL